MQDAEMYFDSLWNGTTCEKYSQIQLFKTICDMVFWFICVVMLNIVMFIMTVCHYVTCLINSDWGSNVAAIWSPLHCYYLKLKLITEMNIRVGKIRSDVHTGKFN